MLPQHIFLILPGGNSNTSASIKNMTPNAIRTYWATSVNLMGRYTWWRNSAALSSVISALCKKETNRREAAHSCQTQKLNSTSAFHSLKLSESLMNVRDVYEKKKHKLWKCSSIKRWIKYETTTMIDNKLGIIYTYLAYKLDTG